MMILNSMIMPQVMVCLSSSWSWIIIAII